MALLMAVGARVGERILAVLRADVVGSVAYLQSHGLDAAIDVRRRVSELLIGSGGETLDSLGDGALVGLRSAAEAIKTAFEVQQDLRGGEFELRIAVTAACVGPEGESATVEDARSRELEQQCPPGDVLVDSEIRRSVRGIAGFAFAEFPADPSLGEVFRVVAIPSEAQRRSFRGTELRAVLLSDRIRGNDGEEAPDARSQQISEACVRARGGVVVDTNNGGSLAFFATCGGALAAASDMHVNARHAGLEFVVGVAVGDVVVEGSDRYGLAVAEAARLLALASTADAPARTLATGDVLSLTNLDAVYPTTRHELRGIDDPVSVVAIGDDPSELDALLAVPTPLSTHGSMLAGRAVPLGGLTQLWRDVHLGTPRAAVVTGEEGIGKTRLVKELAVMAHGEGALVLHGACDADLRVPYAPIANALMPCGLLDPDIARAVDVGTGPLGALWSTEYPDGDAGQESFSEAPDQYELFAAVAHSLGRLSLSRPVLLIVDDIQWADLDTVRMIAHLFGGDGLGRIAIVATCRDEYLEPAHPVHELLTTRRGAQGVDTVPLGPLAVDAVVDVLRAAGGNDPIPGEGDVAEKMHEITGGRPLHLEELIDHLTAQGLLSVTPETGWVFVDDGELPIPESVLALMADRVGQLDEDVRHALVAAAVMGTSFEIEVLADATGGTIEATVKAIEAGVTARLVSEGDDGTCSFADELIRAAVLQELRPSRRALLHEAIALSLERLRPDQIDRLAAHWSAAIGATARSKAVSYLRRVGARDMASAAWESSVERHRQILDLVEGGPTDEEVAAEVGYSLGLSLRKLGRASYRPELLRAADLARAGQNGGLLAKCAIAMMRPGAWYPEADVVDSAIVDMCEDALLLLGRSDPQRARVLAALAVNLTFGSEPNERMALISEAQQIARESDDLVLIGTTLAAELIAFQHPDRFERRRTLAEEVRKIGRATADRDLLFTGSWFLVLDLVATGEVAEASILVTELTEVVQASREYWPSFLLSHFGTALAIARCDDNASDLIDQERLAFEDQPVDWFGVSVIQAAAVAVGRGTLSNMMLSLVAAADEHGSSEWAKKWNYALSRAYVDDGDTDAALAAIAMNPDPEPDYYWVASVYHLGLLGLKTRRRDICEDVIAKLSPYRGRIGIIGLGACLSGQVSTSLGQAYLGMGDLELAEEHFREALAQAEALSFPYFATSARRFLAQTLLEADAADREPARLLDQVIAAAKRYGFALELAEAENMLTTLARPGAS